MASTGKTDSLTRKRILANVQERRKAGDLPEAPPEEETTVDARADAAERILSQPVKIGKTGRKKRKKRPKANSAARIGLLGAIVVAGIAAIIGLRYLAEAFGVNWIGD